MGSKTCNLGDTDLGRNSNSIPITGKEKEVSWVKVKK